MPTENTSSDRDESLLTRLLRRRVPQILGIYIGATWMAIEIGEWLTERLALDPNLTVALFVILIGLLPSVVIFAWNHGAPGKDQWVTAEKTLIPINIIIVVVLVWRLDLSVPVSQQAASPPTTPAPAAQIDGDGSVVEKAVVNEEGDTEYFVVAAESSYNKALAFFWTNETDEEWLSYGIPWLLSVNFRQDPTVGLETPFDTGLLERFVAADFPEAVGEPLSLQLEMAQSQTAQYLLRGNVSRDGEDYVLNVQIIEPDGQIVDALGTRGPDWFSQLDKLASLISENISGRNGTTIIGRQINVADQVSPDLEAIKDLVGAYREIFFHNAYPEALALINSATTRDPTFAYAYAYSSMVTRFMGDTAGAKAAGRDALKYDHKLDSAMRFAIKANDYAMASQLEKAIKVVEMWVEVHPHDVEPLAVLGRNYMLVNRMEDAIDVYSRALALNPRGYDNLIRMAQIRRTMGDFEEAIKLLEQYRAARPDDATGWMQLAQLYRVTGDLDEAESALDRASFLQSDDFDSRLALASLANQKGQFEKSGRMIDELEERQLQPSQMLQVHLARMKLHRSQGRIRDALMDIEKIEPIAAQTMPPIMQLITVASNQALLYTELARPDQATDVLEAMTLQIQPPMNDYSKVSKLGIFEAAQDFDSLRAAIEPAQMAIQALQLHMLEPIIESAQARLALEDGEFTEAVRLYESAIAGFSSGALGMDPESAQYPIPNYVRALRLGENFERAQTIADEQLNRSPFDALTRLSLAGVLADTNRVDEARAQLDIIRAQWSQADPEYIYLKKLKELESQIAG